MKSKQPWPCQSRLAVNGVTNGSDRMETDYHPVELNTNIMLKQRLDYLHENPVRSGLVWEPQHYKYSSAIDYYTNQHGLLPVQHLFF